MFLSFLRFLAYTLMFIFIWRVIVGAFRYVVGEAKKPPVTGPQPPGEPTKTEASAYQDVKDAKFKDLPSDTKNPS